MNESSSADRGIRGVLEVARGVLSHLDLDGVLERVVEAAREVSGARYAALGVRERSRSELERLVTVATDEATRRRIGGPPRGRGVLGEVITHPVPPRVDDLGAHPQPYGFPAGRPPMRTFLGVPVLVGGEPFGNLYLTEKADGGEFTEADERTVAMLAELAGVAIDHAQRYCGLQLGHLELRRTVEALDATLQIARALGGETDLGLILSLVAKRGRALVSARALVIEQEHPGEMVIAAAAGDLPEGLVGQRVDLHDSVAAAAVRRGRSLRLENEPNRARFDRHGLGRLGVSASAGLVVPLLFRGQPRGVLVALDKLREGSAFTGEDERLLEAFASIAATAIANAETVEAERRRRRLAASEQERARWARELDDQTLRSLGALRVALAGARRRADLAAWQKASEDMIQDVEREIENLRAIIADLGPPARDDMAQVEIHADEDHMSVVLRDDGVGFDTEQPTNGVGLVGRRDGIVLAQEAERLREHWEGAMSGRRRPSVLLDRNGWVLAARGMGELPSRLDLTVEGEDGTTVLPDGRGGEVERLECGGAIFWLRRRSRAWPPRLRLRLLGQDASAQLGTGRREHGLRSLELLAVLAMHPEGVTTEQLALALYGERGKAVTIRAQVHRVRDYLGARAVETHPYRLAVPVEADWAEVSRLVAAGRPRKALRAYRGPLLAASDAPEIVEARALLEESLRRSILTTADPDLLSAWLVHPAGADDLVAARVLVAVLPCGGPRRAAATATAAAIARRLSHDAA